MNAFHSFWSEPNKIKNNGEIRLPDYEQLTAVLSALKWRQYNGNIRMITDSCGREYLEDIGLTWIWNDIDTELDSLSGTVDPFLFWAAGKLWALRTMPAPCVMLDTDMIIWENVDTLIAGYDVTAAHPEDLNPNVYPEVSSFTFNGNYSIPEEWDLSLRAANTAFLCIKDEELKSYYTASVMEFSKHLAEGCTDPVKSMCFAEQRILPMCTAVKHKRLGYLFDTAEVYSQSVATHTWGFKRVLDLNENAREQLCMRMIKRIYEDFPEYADKLQNCRDQIKYLDKYNKSKKVLAQNEK